jgi:hypothetical protein
MLNLLEFIFFKHRQHSSKKYSKTTTTLLVVLSDLPGKKVYCLFNFSSLNRQKISDIQGTHNRRVFTVCVKKRITGNKYVWNLGRGHAKDTKI